MSNANILTMKKTISFLFALAILTSPILVFAQSVMQTSLKPGEHKVGFIHKTELDRSRTFTNDRNPVAGTHGYRSINMGIWYPANISDDNKPVVYSDYVELLKIDRGLTDQYITGFINTPNPDKELTSETWAYHAAEAESGPFPVIVYAASFNAPTFENSVLFEYLASYGYVVVSIPSIGSEGFDMTADLKGIEAQTRDIEWVIGQLHTLPYVNMDQLTVMGFSWGGMTNVMAKMRHNKIKALISMDGSISYFYDLFKTSPYADMSKVDVPFLFLGQKIFEMDRAGFRDSTVLFGDFYRDISNSDAQLVRFTNLAHQNFGSHFIKLRARDPQGDSSQELINQGYTTAAIYIHHFLDAHIKDDSKAKEFLLKNPDEIDAASDITEILRKSPD